MPGHFQAVVVEVDHNDFGRSEKLGGQQRGEADGAGTDDGDGVAGLDLAVQHAAFVTRRQDVAEHHHRILVHAIRHRIEAGIRIRDADELGLRAVDGVAENPAARLAVRGHAAPAIVALSTRGNAGDEHAVAGMEAADTGTGFLDDPDPLVAQNATRYDTGQIALEDVQVGAADRGLGDAHDGVICVAEGRLRHVFQLNLAMSAVNESFHRVESMGRIARAGEK